MSRSKAAHKRERKRRHERQIAAGERTRQEKIRKPFNSGRKMKIVRRVLLSEVDPEIVKAVIREVEKDGGTVLGCGDALRKSGKGG